MTSKRPTMVSHVLPLLLSASTGCMCFLATAKFDIWQLAWVAFLPLFYAIRKASPKAAFVLGWVAGLAANLGGFYWIPHLLIRFGQMSHLLAWLLFGLLALYQGLHWGVFAFLVRKSRQNNPALPLTLLAPIFMTTMELVTPFVFDWYLAITQAWNVPTIQIAELTGPLGVTFLLLLVNGALGDLLEGLLLQRPHRLRWRPAAISLGLLGASLVFGSLRVEQIDRQRTEAKKIKVGIVQGNVGIMEKGSAELAVSHHRMHLEQSWQLQQQGADLIVWSESAYPFGIERTRKQDFPANDKREIMRGLHVPVIFGAISYGDQTEYPYNSAFMMSPDGRIVGRYDKNFLLIFGEYIPFYEHIPSFKKWFPAASNYSRGTEVTTFPYGEYRIGPMICYEDILPAFGRRLAAVKPNLLVNLTNDAWFGRTSEPYEHLALAVFRSVELRLDLVRAVNTGVSALVNANGRVMAQTQSYDPVITPGIPPDRLLGQVALMPERRTVYAAVGNLFGYLNLVTAVIIIWASRRRKRRTRRRR